MSKLLETEAFLAVATHGSFAAAARALGLSSSYVSRLVSRLEARLGARLLQRTTRRLTLTPVGERYSTDCRTAFDLLDRATAQAQDASASLSGDIRITAPTGLGLQVLARQFARFAATHPRIRLSVVYLDRMVDLIEERFDLAVRVGPLDDSSLKARKIAEYSRRVVASPAVAASFAGTTRPDELGGAQGVVYSGNARPRRWTLTNGAEESTLMVTPRLTTNSGRAAALAAADGLGLACLPTFHTADLERDGALIRLVPAWGIPAPVHVVFPTNRLLRASVRALIDFLASEYTDDDA